MLAEVQARPHVRYHGGRLRTRICQQDGRLHASVIPDSATVILDSATVIPDSIRDPVVRQDWIADQVRNDNGGRNDSGGGNDDTTSAMTVQHPFLWGDLAKNQVAFVRA